MSTRTLSIEVPEALYAEVEALSVVTARSHTQLALEALRGYVALEAWQLAEIQAGLREADAGDFATEDEVQAVFARHGA